MLILSSIFLILSNAVSLRRDKSMLVSRVGLTILGLGGLLAFNSLYTDYLTSAIGMYGGLYHVSVLTQFFHIFIIIMALVIIQLVSFYPRKVLITELTSINKLVGYNFSYYKNNILNKMGEQFKILEYPLILLFVILGALLLISTSDVVSIFISIELQSYGLYLLCTLYRNSELATSGGLTYFLLGGLSSCFILLGTSLLYTNSGTTNLDGMYVITSISDISTFTDTIKDSDILYWYKSHYINISLLILSIGLLFKVSAAPFHFWSPDVYDAIPTIVTTFVAIIPKISVFILLLELVHYTSNSLFNFEFSWTLSLLVSSLLSLIIGTVVGLAQYRIKRLFAYSTISHVGFLLLALSINSMESIQAFIFYLIQYSITNLNAFIILISIGYSLYCYVNKNKASEDLPEKNHSPIQLISQLKGYFFINPILALSLTITIFSFVGIPPLIGFFAKQMVLSAALDSGYVFLSIVGILTSVIGAVYYLNIIKQIFFDEASYKINPELKKLNLYGYLKRSYLTIQKLSFNTDNIILSSYLSITVSVLTLIILLFIILPNEILAYTSLISIVIYNV